MASLVLLVIWVVKPLRLQAADTALGLLIVALMIASNAVHGDELRRVGLRTDNLPAAARDVGLPTALAACVLLAIGLALGSLAVAPRLIAVHLADYCGWALVQQYALQGFLLQRLVDAGAGNRAPVIAAAIFALLHAPNPGLMVLAFLGAWLWCSSFRRQPNLLAVALSHACLAVVARATLPPGITGGLRTGWGYLIWSGR